MVRSPNPLVLSRALKCTSLGVLIKVVRETQMEYIIQKLVQLSGSKEGELRDIAGLGKYFLSFS